MTSKEFYDQTVTYENDFDFRTMNLMSNYKGIICDLLNEYARIMCQKQKEICAEEGKNCRYGFYEELALNSPFPKELQDVKKIKPFVWKKSSIANHEFAETLFGYYSVQGFTCENSIKYHVVGLVEFDDENMKFDTIDQAKRFAFDDFKRRLEETLGESVGYDLPIDENC